MAGDDVSGSVWAVAITFAVLSWTAVALRVYVRIEQLGKFGLDDKFVLVAQGFFTAYLVCQMGGAAYGTGKRLTLISRQSAETALHFWFFCELWYALAGAVIKIAICLSLLRVTVRKFHKWAIYGLILWSVSLGLAFLLGVTFQCRPPSDWWSLDPQQKNCLEPQTITMLTYLVSTLNVASDWSLGLFPFFIVRDLSIPLSQKIMVASILAFGAVASTATVVRMFYVKTLEQTYLGWDGDFLYDTVPIAILSTVEIGVAVTAICLSTLRPLLSKFRRYVRPQSYYDTRSQGYRHRRHSHESPPPIPLIINPQTGLPDFALSDRSFTASQEEYAGASHFNTTKPLDLSITSVTSVTETDDDSSKRPSTSKPPHINATRFNMTKALTSSYGDSDDESYAVKKSVRRFGGPS